MEGLEIIREDRSIFLGSDFFCLTVTDVVKLNIGDNHIFLDYPYLFAIDYTEEFKNMTFTPMSNSGSPYRVNGVLIHGVNVVCQTGGIRLYKIGLSISKYYQNNHGCGLQVFDKNGKVVFDSNINIVNILKKGIPDEYQKDGNQKLLICCPILDTEPDNSLVEIARHKSDPLQYIALYMNSLLAPFRIPTYVIEIINDAALT